LHRVGSLFVVNDKDALPSIPTADVWARAAVVPLTRTIAEKQRQLVSRAGTIGTLRGERDVALAAAERARASEQTVERQSELIGAQRSELALLRAEVDVLTSSSSPQDASGEPQTVEAPTQGTLLDRWRMWALRLLALVVLVVGVALLTVYG
jgi:hypothetical protein